MDKDITWVADLKRNYLQANSRKELIKQVVDYYSDRFWMDGHVSAYVGAVCVYIEGEELYLDRRAVSEFEKEVDTALNAEWLSYLCNNDAREQRTY